MNTINDNYLTFQPDCTCPAGITDTDLWFIFKEKDLLIKNTIENIEIPYSKDINKLEDKLDNKHYLGKFYNTPCFCGELTGDIDIPSEFRLINLRETVPFMEENLLFVAGKASQIINWNKNFKFCGRCGTPTVILEGHRAKKCPKCNLTNYPNICPAIIVAITKGDKILLAHNKNFPEKLYSVIAGFVEPSETLEHCVKREILEEVGIKVNNIKYFCSQPWPFPNSIMLAFFAEYESGKITPDGSEITDANWFTKDNHPLLPSKHTVARKMIDSFFNYL